MDKNPRISQTENNQNQQEQTSQNLTINPPRYTLIPQRYSPQPKQIQNPNTPVQPPHDETPTRTTTSDIPESSNARNIQSTPRFSFYPEQIIENGVKNCQNSILGKIITEKPIHVSSIQNGLESIWGSPAGLRIQEIQGKILQFFMDNSFDQERILQVAINVHQPITSGIHEGNPTDGTCWMDFRYEKLPQFCFNCGLVGHAANLCRHKALAEDTLAPLGPWIRSTQPCEQGWPTAMKLLTWNCQGLGNPEIKRALKKLIANHHPDIIFLMENKMDKNQQIFRDKFAASYSLKTIDCISKGNKGKSGVESNRSLWETQGDKPRRYEQVWTTDENHSKIVKEAWTNAKGTAPHKLKVTLESLHRWGGKWFGIILRRIKTLQEDLMKLNEQNGQENQDEQIKSTKQELDELLECEEMWWAQRSRALWLQHGDKNTNQETHQTSEAVEVVKGKINEEIHNLLNEKFTRDEVLQAIKDMKPLAAPGPDGLPTLFYHNYWDILGKEISDLSLNVLNNNGDPTPLNNTHICLIPKCNNPSSPNDFRPISICNVTLKIITKTLTNRIKLVLPDVISYNQGAFIDGRLITDNTLMASDIFHYLKHTNRKNGYVGIKTDMVKAYDRVEWSFLEATLNSMGFPHPMTQTIMNNKIGAETKQDIKQILPNNVVDHIAKYLAMLTLGGRSKNHMFNFIMEKVWKKLKGWKEKNLSFAGRSTLIKVVAQAIPTYLMSSFLIPKGICEQMEKMICHFWWGSSTDSRKIHWVKWANVCKHKKEGGIGFRNFRAFNEALLAKQGWRLITNPNSLVAQMLKAKYHPKTVGKGDNIHIWEDNWIHQKGNSNTWSQKPATEYMMVKDIMNREAQGWNEQVIKEIFIPQEAEKILQIPIIDRSQPDTNTWANTRDGNYTVKTGYQAIIDWEKDNQQDRASSSTTNNEHWNMLWKLKVPPKQSHLIWRILNKALPVKQVWLDSPLTINLHYNKITSIEDWIIYMFHHIDLKGMEMVTTVLYNMWFARNQKVFQDKNLPPHEFNNRANLQLRDYQNFNIANSPIHRPNATSRSSHNNSWSPPPRGSLKINVDAHSSGDGHWYSGLILRREDGSTVGAVTCSHKGSEDSSLGEALGLNDGLDWLEREKITEVVIEMDNQVIVNAVKKRASVRKAWGVVVSRCGNFLSTNPNSTITWVTRSRNRVAHELAKWAEQQPDKIWPNSFPCCITTHILKDMALL
ncbi:hypothetical protein TSUD_408220 [Trifolium subterraneum]|uniref:CCHC-type domain-containing protein n=1 Tax=Trifolium subterraneum TaxID=3900 RepID=A0A2Z6P5I3_TRISU|nr:hypothetical protein TSUD_408220 [Trifolium subterraneum]